MGENRDLEKYADILRQTIKEINNKIETLKGQCKQAGDFQFIKHICEQNLLFCDESNKIQTDRLLNVLKLDKSQTDLGQISAQIKCMEREKQECFSLIDMLEEKRMS